MLSGQGEEKKTDLKVHFMSQNPRCFIKEFYFPFRYYTKIHAQQEMDVLLGDFIASHSEYIIKSKRKTWKQKTAPITLYVNIF